LQSIGAAPAVETVLALGDFTRPVLIFGGPYGNIQALSALFEVADRSGVPGENMICTGDLAAYCADPQATVDLTRARGVHVIAGNVEESLGAESSDCGCGFDEGSACDVLASRWYAYATRVLDSATKIWMRDLPRRAVFSMAGANFTVIHGGVERINQFIFPGTPEEEFREEFRIAGTDGVIAGHSGLPFSRLVEGRLWHNAGAIGMPANDGAPHVWYSILSPIGAGEISIEIRSLSYDWRAAADSVRAAALPIAYADALESGLWPSDDVMLESDRARRGAVIKESDLSWTWNKSAVNETAQQEGISA
jgi:hypothetical protein